MRNNVFVLFLLFAGLQTTMAQDVSNYKAIDVDATCMGLDCVINLDDKEQAWQYIIKNYSN